MGKARIFVRENEACSGNVHTLRFGLVQLGFQYLDVWVEFVWMGYSCFSFHRAASLESMPRFSSNANTNMLKMRPARALPTFNKRLFVCLTTTEGKTDV